MQIVNVWKLQEESLRPTVAKVIITHCISVKCEKILQEINFHHFKKIMLILICYDVATVDKAGQKRLRRVARACQDYGQRVQNSVFECRVNKSLWIVLRERLLREMKCDEDSIRFYFLDSDVYIEHHGIKKPVNFEDPLIL
jgi:CRISPR-associated protein Cas2